MKEKFYLIYETFTAVLTNSYALFSVLDMLSCSNNNLQMTLANTSRYSAR